ncbi:MAG: hypothetical protein DWQ30_18035 [Acidobacteria bacterium]|nr:MAG: hypothetical protein DWQ30_18035 [Acidobacteriota bacterium]
MAEVEPLMRNSDKSREDDRAAVPTAPPVGDPLRGTVPAVRPAAVDGRASRASSVLPLLAMFCMAATAQDPRISEIRIDQPSSDLDEYFELAGAPGSFLDDLTYLVIGDGSGGSGTIESVTHLAGQVPGSGFFVAAEATFSLGVADLVATLGFENSDNVSHLLVRDFTGADGQDLDLDDDGTLDAQPWSALLDCVSLVETPGSGDLTYCATTVGPDGSFVPAHVFECPAGFEIGGFDPAGGDDTPGAANSCSGGPPTPPVLVINEVDYDQPGTDSAEFVEIANVGTVAADLSGFVLDLVNGSGGGATIYGTIALPAVSLSPGDYFVVCANAATVANCDLDVSPDTNLVQNGAPDAVALVTLLDGSIADTVSYEGDTGAPYTEGSGAGLEDSGDGSISRCPDGADSDQNGLDFVFAAATPGAANDCGVVGGGALVINEIDYDQPGTDTAEFIELLNVDTVSVDLSGFAVELINGSGGGASSYGTFPLPAVTLAPGEYFVLCSDVATVGACDLPVLSSIQNGAPDAVALTSGGAIVDTVSYEGDVPGFTEGSGVGLEDDGGGGVGGPNDFKGLSRLPDGLDSEQNALDFQFVCVTPGAPNTSATSGCIDPAPPQLVINEIDYDQPGADGAEFVEIHNRGDGAAELGGLELRLVNGSGGGAIVYQTVVLPAGTLGPGGYFVVCADALAVANCDLAALSSIQNGSPDAVAIATVGGDVLDTVSYEGDTGAPYTEGSGVGLEDSGSTGEDHRGIGRFPNGVDSDRNSVDLVNACITPGRANTSATSGCGPQGPVVEIFQIQGAGLASPFEGQTAATEQNVVTALAADGFFVQTPTARSDADTDTSDGIFVFTGAAPSVSVGDLVDVVGEVNEFFDFTELAGLVDVTVVGAGSVPAAIELGPTVPSPDPTAPSCAIELECYEGMLVSVEEGTVGGPNQRFNPDPIAEVHITAGVQRAFREPGIEFPGLPGLPVWDGNPEVFELDPDRLGLANQVIPAGSTFSATGVIGYEFGGYELWPSELTVQAATLPAPVRAATSEEITIATLNLFRLFDDVDDGNGTVVDSVEYQRRLEKFSRHIRDVLRAPDVLAVQEVEKLGVLEDLADRIELDDPALHYTPYLVEGNDVGGIDVGFLVSDRIAVDAVTQMGATELLTFDGSLLHDRPPLLLEGSFSDTGGNPRDFGVLALHQRSLGGIDDPSDGPRVRQKRLEQAQSVAQMVQDFQTGTPDALLAVVGDFNAFEFSDGYVDVVGQIRGEVEPSDNLLSGPDLVDPDLVNTVLALAPEQRYSFVFAGSAQTLDHALISQALVGQVTGVAFGRGNADAALDLINDASTSLRSSDHDGLVVFVSTRFDADGDGVADEDDLCAGTVIPESVPTQGLRPNHYALVDGDFVFDTVVRGNATPEVFTTSDTGGCSCEQIIDELHLGNGHRKHGCSVGVMRGWVGSMP